MDIVIIGTGNAATALGRKLWAAGHKVLQVYGRNPSSAKTLSSDLGAQSVSQLENLTTQGEIYIIAVSDAAVEIIAKHLRLQEQIVVHTAASLPLSILQETTVNYGVFYPLQTLKKETGILPEIPFIIDAINPNTLKKLEELSRSVSRNVFHAGDDLRKKIHLAAVLSNNFVNHIYTLTENFCKKENISFELLLPLIRETTARLNNFPPSEMQTGPAIRNDTITMKMHLQLLEEYPELNKIYRDFSDSIYQWNLKSVDNT